MDALKDGCHDAYLSLVLLDISFKPLNLLYVTFTGKVRNREESQGKASIGHKMAMLRRRAQISLQSFASSFPHSIA
jgi:hypothetical protein